jgi:hypothetical protein
MLSPLNDEGSEGLSSFGGTVEFWKVTGCHLPAVSAEASQGALRFAERPSEDFFAVARSRLIFARRRAESSSRNVIRTRAQLGSQAGTPVSDLESFPLHAMMRFYLRVLRRRGISHRT